MKNSKQITKWITIGISSFFILTVVLDIELFGQRASEVFWEMWIPVIIPVTFFLAVLGRLATKERKPFTMGQKIAFAVFLIWAILGLLLKDNITLIITYFLISPGILFLIFWLAKDHDL